MEPSNSSNCPYHFPPGSDFHSLEFLLEPNNSTNLTAIFQQCPQICDIAIGNGNPDLLGIGLFVTYCIQLALTSLFTLISYFGAGIPKAQESTRWQLFIDIHRLFVETNAYIILTVVMSSFARTLQPASFYEHATLRLLIPLQADLLTFNLLALVLGGRMYTDWRKFPLYLFYLLLVVIIEYVMLYAGGMISAEQVYFLERIIDNCYSSQFTINSELFGIILLSSFPCKTVLHTSALFGCMLRDGGSLLLKKYSLSQNYGQRIEKFYNYSISILSVSGSITSVVLYLSLYGLTSLTPDPCTWNTVVGMGLFIFLLLGDGIVILIYRVMLRLLPLTHSKEREESSHTARRNESTARYHNLTMRISFFPLWFYLPFLCIQSTITINRSRYLLREYGTSADIQSEWGVGQIAAILTWLPLITEVCFKILGTFSGGIAFQTASHHMYKAC
ncbi:hypothetical protein BDZ91DRAFT_555531 [Kalaharituber pfeilii]|nr:hypothetical protein BDZ91DRAFT_555531 [Kalaharituber pfeilii]